MLDVQREKREVLFALRLTQREHEELSNLARKNDMRMVDLVRLGLNEATKKLEAQHEQQLQS